jgi:hypothetical protein
MRGCRRCTRRGFRRRSEAWVAEQEILQHLPGVVIGGRAEVYFQAQNVPACHAVRDFDGGVLSRAGLTSGRPQN